MLLRSQARACKLSMEEEVRVNARGPVARRIRRTGSARIVIEGHLAGARGDAVVLRERAGAAERRSPLRPGGEGHFEAELELGAGVWDGFVADAETLRPLEVARGMQARPLTFGGDGVTYTAPVE